MAHDSQPGTQDERERPALDDVGFPLDYREAALWHTDTVDRMRRAGWSPRPSGDVIESTVSVLWAHEWMGAGRGCRCGFPPDGYHARHQTQALADAGLLRTPGEQDDDSMAAEILRLHERLRTPGESVSIPVPPPDEDRWWESLTEAVPPDGCEHAATFVDSEDIPACPWCTIDRLRAAGEGQHG